GEPEPLAPSLELQPPPGTAPRGRPLRTGAAHHPIAQPFDDGAHVGLVAPSLAERRQTVGQSLETVKAGGYRLHPRPRLDLCPFSRASSADLNSGMSSLRVVVADLSGMLSAAGATGTAA